MLLDGWLLKVLLRNSASMGKHHLRGEGLRNSPMLGFFEQ